MTIKQQGGIFGRTPSFKSIELDGADLETTLDAKADLAGDTFTGQVNINTSGTGGLSVTAAGNGEIVASRTSGASVKIQSQSARGLIGTTSNHGFRLMANGAQYVDVSTSGNLEVMSGNLVIGTSGKGIDFSATAGTGTSELFDDYEEGRFDTVLTDTGAGSTITLTRARCDYVKAGRLVHVTGEVTIDTITGTPTGDIQMTLPFVGATSNQRSARSRRFISITSLAGIATGHGEGFIEGNGATVMTLQKADDFIITNLALNIQSGTNFQFDFTYQSAS